MTLPRFGYRGMWFPSWMLTFSLSLGLLAPEKASFNFMEATLLREPSMVESGVDASAPAEL